MDRRAFFRGTGALGAAIATGGTNAVIAPLATVSSVATAAAVGGDLIKTIGTLISSASTLDQISSHIKHSKSIHGIFDLITGQSPFGRYPETERNGSPSEYSNKISFDTESDLYNILKGLPNDISIDDIFDDTIASHVGEIHRDAGASILQIRPLLEPFKGNAKSIKDVMGVFENHFVRLAEHAIKNPDDFVFEPGHMDSYEFLTDSMTGETASKRILDILQHANRGKKDPKIDSIIERLKPIVNNATIEGRIQHRETIAQRIQVREAVRNAEQDKRDTERIRQQEDADAAYDRQVQQKIENPSLRRPFIISISATDDGNRFVVENIRQKSPDDQTMPTRVDWHHWLLTQFPNNAHSPGMIEVKNSGKTIIVRSPEAIAFIRASTDEEDGLAIIKLPNKRSNFDLNHPPALLK